MPKIIENLREKLLDTARRQVREEGYAGLTMRSVAEACGVGVGTVYNYFPSKESLVASFVAEDWHTVTERALCASDRSALQILSDEYDGIRSILDLHRRLFSDPEAIRIYAALPRERHEMLRAQLAQPLETALEREGCGGAAFLSLFLAESLLTWAIADVDRNALFSVLRPLLNTEKEYKE